MFSQLKRINSESGIVLFIVLMVAIVIMLFSVGILTQSMNETNYAQQQIDQITSDQLSKGLFWNAYSNSYFLGTRENVGISTTMQGRAYSVALNVYSVFINTDGMFTNFQTTSNYDTFQ